MKPLLIPSGGGHVTTEKKQTITTNAVRETAGVCVVFLFVSLGHCLSRAVEPNVVQLNLSVTRRETAQS